MIALWRGKLPLAHAFWLHAVLYVALLNLATTFAALATVAAEWPGGFAVGIFLLPIPYIFVAVVGVWRSAASYDGSPQWAILARLAAAAWGGLMALT